MLTWHRLVLLVLTTICGASISSSIKIPIGMTPYNPDLLPIYCTESTGYFKCSIRNVHTNKLEDMCLPISMKCHKDIRCENDIKCSQKSCNFDEYQCRNRDLNDASEKTVCIKDEWLCDGINHCDFGDDEHVELCKTRICSPSQFACASQGHCIDSSKRCDGHHDCQRQGLRDLSDEANCVNRSVLSSNDLTCDPVKQFMCADKSKCIDNEYKCDEFRDCDDGSDEVDCKPKKCSTSQFSCDGKCLPKSVRCNDKWDCTNGEDEKECDSVKCTFGTQSYCPLSKKCMPFSFFCDGSSDCKHGDDEICPLSRYVCKNRDYWTCKDGKYCIMKRFKCDGIPQCYDGSDEFDCPTEPPKFSCPLDMHKCSGANNCVNVMDVCNKKTKCPYPDSHVDQVCEKVKNETSPCKLNNGGCLQLCHRGVKGEQDTVSPICLCNSGFTIDPRNKSNCLDVDECRLFGKCSQKCINTYGSFACSCNSGYILTNNTCRAPGGHKLLVGTAHHIFLLDQETGHHDRKITTGNDVIKYLDYDSYDKRIFYSSRSGILGYFNLIHKNNKMDFGIFLRDIEVDTIAFDWVNKLLFYAVPANNKVNSTGSIGVIDVVKNKSMELLRLDCPRGLAIHPGLGYLFIAQWCGADPGIYRVKLDGRDLRKVVSGRLKRPGHLSIDFAQSEPRIYWSDSYLRGIFSAKLDGTDLRAIWHLKNHYSGNVYDLSVFEDRVFWNDLTVGSVYSVNKFNGEDLRNECSKTKLITTVTVMHQLRQPQYNQLCSSETCGHICVPVSTSSTTCLCDNNYELQSDHKTCVLKKMSSNNKVDGSDSSIPTNNKSASPVGSIAGIVIGCLLLVVIIGGVLVFCINRTNNKQSVEFTNDSYQHNTKAICKINSRTPLTECEESIIRENTCV